MTSHKPFGTNKSSTENMLCFKSTEMYVTFCLVAKVNENGLQCNNWTM